MALEIKGMKRVFKMKKNSQEIVLDDPNVNMSPAEVMDFYSHELSGTDHRDRTRTGNRRRPGGI